jgi:acetylornithine deacetylase/succinyl-diaminopimelate desuccinylase-like protein
MTCLARSFVALSGVLAITLASATPPARAQSDAVTPSLIEKTAQANFPEFFDLLSMPNDAINAQDIRKNADWLEAAFRKRGFVTKQLPNNGRPLVFAEFARKSANAKTILFYMHFDGQPVIPGQWSQKSPWIAAVKRQNAKAFDALSAAGAVPAVNVKVLLDSEEEKGSQTIGIVAKANRELLAADAIVINDGPVHPSNRPTIVFGNRGNTLVRLTVFGPKNPLHSGHFGNYAPNPAQRLAALLASMKDDDGRVTVAGYYDGVKLTEAERRLLAEVPDDETELRKRIGTARPESVGGNYQEALQYPSLNIRGMAAAAIGDTAANIVPSDATAELDLRTTPGADPAYLVNAIEAHIRGRGYHLVQGAPSEEERATYDKIASVTVGRGSKAAFTPIDSPIGRWVQDTLARTFATATGPAKTVRIRMMGGSVPTDKLVEALELPFVIVPLVNGDNNQHSFDENLRLGQFLDGTRAFTGLLRSPF